MQGVEKVVRARTSKSQVSSLSWQSLYSFFCHDGRGLLYNDVHERQTINVIRLQENARPHTAGLTQQNTAIFMSLFHSNKRTAFIL